MNFVTAEELMGKAANKYEAVVVAALRARQLNRLDKKMQEARVVPDEEEVGGEPKKIKVTVVAMRELIEGKINYRQEE